MKNASGSIVLVLCFLSMIASANDQIADGRAMIKAEREAMIQAELQLTESEAAEFWPLYEVYRQAYDEIMQRYGAMLAEYLRLYDNAELSNDYADEMIETYFGVKQEMLQAQLDFLPELRAILPALMVARFFQLENRFNAEIDAQLALIVPLADPT